MGYTLAERDQIERDLKEFFDVRELVGKKTYRKHGQRSLKFFRTEALHALLITRVNINRRITANNWHMGGRFSQRGLRTNVQQIFRSYFVKMILYLSGHPLGAAFDFDVEGMTPNEVRSWILDNQELYPMRLRLERKFKGKYINWVHMDTISEPHNPKVYLFDV